MNRKLRIKDKTTSFYRNREDFLIRSFGITSRQVMLFLTITLAIIPTATYLLYDMYKDIAGPDYNIGMWRLSACMTSVIVGVVLLISGKQVEVHKHAIDATEFLNALFSSVISSGQTFSVIIVRPDERIFYLNKGFQEMFPDVVTMENPKLDAILKKHGVSDAECEALLHAVKRGVTSEIKLQIPNKEQGKKAAHYTVTVEPIARPAGFCLIRGQFE